MNNNYNNGNLPGNNTGSMGYGVQPNMNTVPNNSMNYGAQPNMNVAQNNSMNYGAQTNMNVNQQMPINNASVPYVTPNNGIAATPAKKGGPVLIIIIIIAVLGAMVLVGCLLSGGNDTKSSSDKNTETNQTTENNSGIGQDNNDTSNNSNNNNSLGGNSSVVDSATPEGATINLGEVLKIRNNYVSHDIKFAEYDPNASVTNDITTTNYIVFTFDITNYNTDDYNPALGRVDVYDINDNKMTSCFTNKNKPQISNEFAENVKYNQTSRVYYNCALYAGYNSSEAKRAVYTQSWSGIDSNYQIVEGKTSYNININ